MKVKKMKALLLTSLLAVSMLMGCADIRTSATVEDATIYDANTDNMTLCSANNVAAYFYSDALESHTMTLYRDNYYVQIRDEDYMFLLCNMDGVSLSKLNAQNAQKELRVYFENTALDLDLTHATGRYASAQDKNPVTGKETTFFKVIFENAPLKYDDMSLTCSVALITYDNTTIACVFGVTEDSYGDKEIANVMKSVCMIQTDDYSTGDGEKRDYAADKLVPFDEISDDSSNENYDYEYDIDEDFEDEDFEDENLDEKDIDDVDDIDIDDADIDDDDSDDKDSDNEDKKKENIKSNTIVDGSDVYEVTISIDGATFSLPADFDDFTSEGWEADTSEDEIIESYDSATVIFADENGNEITTHFTNESEDALPLSQCVIESLSVDTYDMDSSVEVILGESIVLGKTSLSEILDEAGTPDYEYYDDDFASISYSESDDYYLDNSFTFTNEILTDITLYFSEY